MWIYNVEENQDRDVVYLIEEKSPVLKVIFERLLEGDENNDQNQNYNYWENLNRIGSHSKKDEGGEQKTLDRIESYIVACKTDFWVNFLR